MVAGRNKGKGIREMKLERIIAKEIRFALPTILESKDIFPSDYGFHGPYFVRVCEDAEMRHPILGGEIYQWAGELEERPISEEEAAPAIFISIERAHGHIKYEKRFSIKLQLSSYALENENFFIMDFICDQAQKHFDNYIDNLFEASKGKISEVAQ